MSANYSRLRKWSDKFTPQIKQIVGNELVEIADFEADTHEATDVYVLQCLNWWRSRGVRHEIEVASECGVKITFVEVGED